MKHVSHSSLCAVAAIAATLALGSTPAAAQDAAAPTIVLPPADTGPATPPAATTPVTPALPAAQGTPTIVLPPEVTQAAQAPAADAPVSTPAPAAPAETSQAEPARAAVEPKPVAKAEKPAPTRAASTAATAPASDLAGTADEPSLADGDLDAPAPVMVPEAAQPDAPVAEAPQPDSVRTPVDVPDEAIAGAAVAVLGLGIAGFVATRRRRKDDVLDDDIYEAENQYVEEEPVTSIPSELETRSESVIVPEPVAATPVSTAAYAGGPVPTGEARQRLLDAMVASPPDSANPFTSRRARRKRARIILQAREHRQRQQTSEPFDWRTYQSSATLDPADPPLVDA